MENYADNIKVKLNQAIADTLACRGSYSNDIRHFTRTRQMPMETVARLMLGMSGGSLALELHKAGIDITPSGFIQQRDKISSTCFHDILLRFNKMCESDDTARFKDKFLLWAVDGTTIPTPRNPTSQFYVNSNPTGFCNIHANVVHDLLNKIHVDCYIGRDEQGALYSLVYRRRYDIPTILVLDRGYESYNTIAHLSNISPNFFFVLRVKTDSTAALKPIKALPLETFDKDESTFITTRQRNIDKEHGYIFLQTGSKKGKQNSPKTRITRWDFSHINPYPLNFRVVRFPIGNSYETLVTNLDRADVSIKELEYLYHMRWGIETSFRFLKTCVGLAYLHSKKDDALLSELFSHLTMSNFCFRTRL